MKNKKIICHGINNEKYEVSADKLTWRPSVYGVLIENNKVLLSPQWDGYDFPGGGMHIHETIEEALKREFFEETGLKVEPVLPLQCDSSYFTPSHSKKMKGEFWNTILIYFLVKKIGGEINTDNFDEEEKEYARKAEWFSPEEAKNFKFYNGTDSPVLIKKAMKIKKGAEGA